MTNEELFQDLKQFVAATVHQEVAPLASDLRILKQDVNVVKDDIQGLKQDVRKLDAKLDEVQLAIADTLDHAIQAVDSSKQVQDHEGRLRRLEQRRI
jgi:uncharacterized protein YlxW (UPF0749 family)